jgi:hypothetical protein
MEDLYFTNAYSDVDMKKPPYEKAKLFSVDEVFSAVSFGSHRPWGHAHYGELVKLHPELETLKGLQYTLELWDEVDGAQNWSAASGL